MTKSQTQSLSFDMEFEKVETDQAASSQQAPAKELDPAMVRVDGLPSMGYPYGGPHENFIHIRPLRWAQMELLARAAEMDVPEPVIQAVGQCIDRDVNSLTIPDFYYLLYWLRINSFPSTPYYLPWRCDEELEKGTCNTENVSPLTARSLMITDLEELGWTPTHELPEHLDWPRVSLLPQLFRLSRELVYKEAADEARLRLQEAANPQEQADLRRSLRLAENRLRDLREQLKDPSYPQGLPAGLIEVLRWVHKGNLAERHAFLLQQPDLSLFEKARAADDQWTYGVHEETTVTCKECGASRLYRVVVDVPTFLS